MEKVKTCKVCGATEFYKNGKCAPCERKKGALYRAENRELLRQKYQEWKQQNPEKAKEATLRWRSNNKDKVAKTTKEWREKNKDKVHACATKSRKKYAQEHPEKVRESQAAYRKRNPDLFKIYKHNRRAREAGGELSVGVVDKLRALQKSRCACCKVEIGDNYHLDHRMPLALGGTNTDDNMQLLCKSCNLQKSAIHPIEFMQRRGFLL